MLKFTAIILATVATADYKPLKWTDCSDSQSLAQVWGVSITPEPQYLGEPWTIHPVFLPLIDFTQDLAIRMHVKINNLHNTTVHSKDVLICNATSSTVTEDGLGQCPYTAGAPIVVHDTNLIPSQSSLGPYAASIWLTATEYPNQKLACFAWDMTYSGRNASLSMENK